MMSCTPTPSRLDPGRNPPQPNPGHATEHVGTAYPRLHGQHPGLGPLDVRTDFHVHNTTNSTGQ